MRYIVLLISSGMITHLYASDELLNKKIQFLLTQVKQTKCQVERNGQVYNGEKAAGHIQRKYDYYKKKIDSIDRFIALSATKSLMSGKYYLIRCPGKPEQRLADWLRARIAEFKAAKN